jgi:glycosyltransferase involved in cell wall biosynthesis
MKNAVKVSVIIPTYNAAQFVTAAIDSVLAQTFQDVEILVVDDGSTDDTKNTLAKYGDRIEYLYKQNGGVAKARNYAIERAQGEYVAFLDADDLWLPEKLAKQIALFESRRKIGLCYTGAEIIDENLAVKGHIDAATHEDACEKLLLTMNIMVLSSVMVRREIVLQTEGFDSHFSTTADKEFWLRLSLLTKFAAVPDYLVKYRDVTGSMSSDPFLSKRDTLETLNKFFSLPDLPEKYRRLKNESLSNNLMVVAGEFLHNKKFGESLKCMWQSIKYHPSNIKRPLGLPIRLVRRFLPD